MIMPVTLLSPAASPITARHVAVNQKLSTASKLYMMIPAMFFLMIADRMLSADIAVRKSRIAIMVICRKRT